MSLVFKCKYCPDTFPNFKKLVEHYETEHNPDNEQHRKLMGSITHTDSDNGCQQATDYLGRQSHCILLDKEHNIIDQCPFRKCILDEPGFGFARAKKAIRNEEIIKLFEEGISIPDLARVFDVSKRTIQRAVKR